MVNIFLNIHRYHSGQYYSPEGFQTAPEGKNTNKDVKNNKKQNIASDIITSVNNKNTSDEKLDSLQEEEEQVEVDNSDKELEVIHPKMLEVNFYQMK